MFLDTDDSRQQTHVMALILAGGFSRRLGFSKQLIVTEGETLLAQTYRKLVAAGLHTICIVSCAIPEVAAQARRCTGHVIVIPDLDNHGIGSSLKAGLRALIAQECKRVLVALCDQPRLTAKHYRRLITERGTPDPIVATSYMGVSGAPCVIPERYFSEIFALSDGEGARSVLARHTVVTVDADDGRFDIDTPDDYGAFLTRTMEKQRT